MNYFTVANKECDQDNFIHWLMESFDSNNSDEKEACYSFLRMAIETINDNDSIEVVKVRRQVNLGGKGQIDFLCMVKTSKQLYLLAIEDKIDASIKNNLAAYYEYISNNQKNLIANFGCHSENVKTNYILLKTGIHLSSFDEKKIKNSHFKLIDRNMFFSCLSKYKNHYLIGDFLQSKDYSDLTPLNKFQRKKNYLCDYLSKELGVSIQFYDNKYQIENFENYYSLHLNDFSLSSSKLDIYVVGKYKKGLDNSYFKIIKSSKYNRIASKHIELKTSNILELKKELIVVIDEAKKLIQSR